ncbi:hypothetical protein BDQ17DRAFT_1433923 [Cyathus striatus]|nr:hypothetical protein BDQ17DRAFT_1433923 [Cyathus striatus]
MVAEGMGVGGERERGEKRIRREAQGQSHVEHVNDKPLGISDEEEEDNLNGLMMYTTAETFFSALQKDIQ